MIDKGKAVEAQALAIIEQFSEEGFRAVGNLITADQLREMFEDRENLCTALTEHMEYINKLIAERDQLRELIDENDCNSKSITTLKMSTDEAWRRVKEVEAERDQYKVDAERYRWLRHGDNDDDMICNDKMGTTFLLRNEQLDAAIDNKIKHD